MEEAPRTKRRRCSKKTSPALACRVPSPPPTAPFTFPPTPNDPRWEVDGAEFDAVGNLKDAAYVDFKEYFCNEPPWCDHPVPCSPGVAADESVPLLMRMWDDERKGYVNRGAGWVATKFTGSATQKKEERWFSARTWGSWRLAFLLARLQRRVWETRHSPFATVGSSDSTVTCGGMQMSAASLRLSASAIAQSIRLERESAGFSRCNTMELAVNSFVSLSDRSHKFRNVISQRVSSQSVEPTLLSSRPCANLGHDVEQELTVTKSEPVTTVEIVQRI